MSRSKEDDECVVDEVPADEKLGPELIEKIAEKEWKTAPLPTEEELAKEKHKSPKARSNPNSRKNLVQYNKNKKKETKEKIVKGIKFKEKREKVNPFDYIKIPDDFDKNLIIPLLPSRRSLKSAQEEKTLYSTVNVFLNDFDVFELTASDIEDIVNLAMNKILESRLLEAAENDAEILMDIAQSVERFRKHSDKVKSNLASTRSARIDPKNKQNFSIADIVYAYDDAKKQEYSERIKKMERENEEYKRKKGLR